VDSDTDGQPDQYSWGDDGDGNDDEEGIYSSWPFAPGENNTLNVTASVNGFLNAWIDLNNDGDWSDPYEQILTDSPVFAGINELDCSLPLNAHLGLSYGRFRFNTTGGLSYDGLASDGEVEDHRVSIKGLDFGDAPPPYPTTRAQNGARHISLLDLYLGNSIDDESDGQPSSDAKGDDDDGNDDEDGITFTSALIPGNNATIKVEVVNTRNGVLNAWIDFNRDGDWADSGEQIFSDEDVLYEGGFKTMYLSFAVPPGASTGSTFARFRLSQKHGISYNGLTGYGEVEDYEIVIGEDGPYPAQPFGEWDFGDAPEGKIGRVTYYYPTTMENNGARHRIVEHGPTLGGGPDAEPNGQPNISASGDDDSGVNDEYAGWYAGSPIQGITIGNTIHVMGARGHVDAWIDFNRDGTWQHPEELVISRFLPVGYNQNITYVTPTTALPGKTYSRIRINSQGPLPPYGPADDGEVQDGVMTIYELDYGDAPDPPYPTLDASGGPRTRVHTGLFFGSRVDGELDGQPDAHALGDDNDGTNDDDGVKFLTKLIPGQQATVEVIVSGTVVGDGHANQEEFFAWIDFNKNGHWENSEMVIRQPIDTYTGTSIGTHTGTCTFTVPQGALLGTTYARFALDILSSENPDPEPTNQSVSWNDFGEIEDYEIVIGEDGPYPAGPPSGGDCGDANGDGVVDMTDAVYILRYLYSGGPPPVCDPLCSCADTNGDGLVGISDAIVLLSNIFLGYPLPSGACCPGTGEQQLDFGDAPLPYPDASHQLGGPYLGPPGDSPDPEQGMQRNTQASGDDNDGDGDDENGLVDIDLMKTPGGGLGIAHIKWMAAPWQQMRYRLWIDLNIDNDWDDPGELVCEAPWTFGVPNVGIGGGSDLFWVNLPGLTKAGRTYARLRIWDDNSILLPPSGPGGPGEVEDYEVEIEVGRPAIPDGGIIVGLKWNDLDGDGFPPDPGEPPLAGWTIRYDSNNNGVLDSQDASTTTDTDGQFTFTGVKPGTYLVGEDQQPGWIQTFPSAPGTHTVTIEQGQKLFVGLFFGNRESGPGGAGGAGGKGVHVKWSQPPIEIDPDIEQPPVFCGWGESALSTELTDQPRHGSMRQWRMLVDDFHCLGNIPITAIRWWGSYQNWQGPEPPEQQPMAWHIGFWANTVDGLESDELYPERLVWDLVIPNERIRRRSRGFDEFPQRASEMCFGHDVRLEPEEWFHQAEFTSKEGIFWLSITAVYPPDAEPVNMWNWTTRPHTWGRGAQIPTIMGQWPSPEERLLPGSIMPLETAQLCNETRAYDLCFDLLTEDPWVKWDQPFVSFREWPGCTDHTSIASELPRGALQVQRQVADDWSCQGADPVTAVSWHGSYLGYGYEACKCDEPVEPRRPDYFLLSIWTNAASTGRTPGHRPGEKIWEYAAYDYDEVLVGYDREPEGEPNEAVFHYSVRLPAEAWFWQETPESVFWFSVMAVFKDTTAQIPYYWGWTSHEHIFGSAAMVMDYDVTGPPWWQETPDQALWPVDMSFTLFTAAQAVQSGQVAHWRFDETRGSIAADSVGGHHGTVHGATWAQGAVGGALRFNGDDYVEVVDETDFDLTEAITVAAWVNLEAVNADWLGIITKGDSTWRLSTFLAERRFHFAVNDLPGSHHSVDGTVRMGLNEWHYLVGTYDGSSIRLYVDGVEDPASPAAYAGPIYTDDFPVWIGANAEQLGRNFIGRIDEVQVYDHALTQTELLDLMANTE
jgi:hypothetical protein